MKTHILKLKHQTLTVEIVEEQAQIVVKMKCDKYGKFGERVEIDNWLLSILQPYNQDSRPLVMTHPLSGEKATVYGDSQHSAVIIEPSPSN